MKKKPDICAGGVEHPARPGMKCWGNHNLKTEGHWAYVQYGNEMRRISWRTET